MKYVPHDYQAYATDFILMHPEAAVLLDMGLGKSVITLTAIQELCLDAFEISRVLVIAPLRVARDTWPAELQRRTFLCAGYQLHACRPDCCSKEGRLCDRCMRSTGRQEHPYS